MIPELPASTLAEVVSLADDLDALITRKPRTTATPFDERRRALLSKHLGREAPQGIEPITCLGDSNTMFFAGAERLRFIRYRRSAFWKPHWINRGLDLLPCFRVFHVGPATAWKAGDPGSSTRSREKIEILLKKDIKPGSRILMSFGEIDCRIHMAKAVKAGGKIEEVVEKTAAKFVKLPAEIAARGFKPAVWGPPQIIPKDEKLSSPTFPFIGSYEMRRDITYAYVERLKFHCAEQGIPFLSVAGLYHPREEKAERALFHDGTHLSQRLMPLALRELQKAGILQIP
ncbi:SGNH/GDSL hydrolase family protein [Luteolibacter sp. GHJ8]|uniref:SGNH/GDSL hydrolase family protein n=1 Tax=Luteolibacter rhizosphaerae TaxID=2989719 RepID=A0ABT3G396_9BACT|nr:SGNH/GDSL hydrolase family protein [Luteolibacter rhizosphaerae]MCW1914314.1 SGNH/GDSL hydrolase family protein [Luteolibacter rhizosphaerae]